MQFLVHIGAHLDLWPSHFRPDPSLTLGRCPTGREARIGGHMHLIQAQRERQAKNPCEANVSLIGGRFCAARQRNTSLATTRQTHNPNDSGPERRNSER